MLSWSPFANVDGCLGGKPRPWVRATYGVEMDYIMLGGEPPTIRSDHVRCRSDHAIVGSDDHRLVKLAIPGLTFQNNIPTRKQAKGVLVALAITLDLSLLANQCCRH
jgi:hypothetical protein